MLSSLWCSDCAHVEQNILEVHLAWAALWFPVDMNLQWWP